MDKEFRRCRSELSLLGSGMIVLTVWELVKSILITLLVPMEQAETNVAAEGRIEARDALLVLVITGWVILSIVLRLYVGFSARAEAAGKRRGKLYVIFSFVLFISQLSLLAEGLVQIIASGLPDDTVPESVVSLFVEITSLVVVGQLTFTAIRFRKLSRQNAE